MDDKDKKDFDDLIIRRKESNDNKNAPKDFDAIITRKDTSADKPKSSIVTPNSPKIDIDRASKKEPTTLKPNGIETNLFDNPFESKNEKSKKEEAEEILFIRPNKEPIMPTRTGFSVKNPNKTNPNEKPENINAFNKPVEPDKKPDTKERVEEKEKPKSSIVTPPNINIDRNVRLGKVGLNKKEVLDVKPLRQDPNSKDKEIDTIKYVKPAEPVVPKDIKADILETVEEGPEEKPEVTILGEVPVEERKPEPPKSTEPEVHKTTTSTLKKKPGVEIPEDESLEAGAQAGSKKYKADTRLDKKAKSLKKYGKEFDKWKKSQEQKEQEDFYEGDVKVHEGRNSERVITIALILVVILILCLFLLFYCNIIVPTDDFDDGRVRISVEIDKNSIYDVDINGNVEDKVIYPGDFINFNVNATNAYNIKGDNATSFKWDSIFVRFKMYLRIDGEEYETIKVNMSNKGEKEVPVIIPTIDNEMFQTYDKVKEDKYVDKITGIPIVQDSDGFYYYNGILNYNQTISLCSGILINGEAIIPDFANKRCEIVVVVDAATADYTSIRERTIWEKAPQNWINFMHDNYFPSYI